MCWKVPSSSRDQFWAGPALSSRHWWVLTLTVNHSPSQVLSLSLRMLPHTQCWFCLLKASAFSEPTHASPPHSLCFLLPLSLAWWFSLFSHLTLRKAGDRKREKEKMTLAGHMYLCSSFSSHWPLSAVLPFSCFVFCSHNPSCTQLSTYSAPAPLQLSKTREHTVMLTHLKFMIMNLKRVLGTILRSFCISLVHSLSCPSRWPFPSCLLLSSQTLALPSHSYSQWMTLLLVLMRR